MKMNIDLGKNVKVKVDEKGYELISDTTRVTLDSNGDLVSCENENELLEQFVKIGEKERQLVASWFQNERLYGEVNINVDSVIASALSNIKYDFWIEVVENRSKAEENFKEKLPEYEIGRATKEEQMLWCVYNIAKGKWNPRTLGAKLPEECIMVIRK